MRNREGIKGISDLVVFIIIITSIILGFSCGVRKDFRQGEEAMQNKEWDQAVAYFLKAVREHPDNVECRISLSNALISASNHHLQKGKQYLLAGKQRPALMEFEKSLEYNPENNEARQQKHRLLKQLKALDKQQRDKTAIEKLKDEAAKQKPETPQVKYEKKPYTLKFVRSDLVQIFKALQKSSGVGFIFDEAFKSKRIALNLENVNFMDALEKIMIQTNLFYKVIDLNTILVIPDTPTKRKQYEELVMKTLFLSNGNPENIQKIVRSLTGMKIIAVDKDLNTITFKGTPEEVKLAEKIVRIHDKPKGELFIDIEIIEVNRARVREYGIELSQYYVTESYFPETGAADSTSTASTIRAHMLPHTDASDYLLTLPSINYKLLKTDRHSNIKARPQLRVVDRQKVEVRLGDKVPIPTTSFVPYNVQGPAQQPITSYQMQDIGINIEVTPQIHHDGLVTLEMKFELTFITDPGTERLPPTIGNRSVTTTIKLRDNETSILAGLLRDTERRSMSGLPFISRVPVLKEIFSGNKNEVEQTDIILTLTPRIIRFPEIREEDLDMVWVGTQARPGLKPPPSHLKLEDETETKESTESPEIKKETDKALKKTKEPGKEKKKEEEKIKGPQTEMKPLTLSTRVPSGNIKKNIETDISLVIKGESNIRTMTLEFDFNPTLVQVLDVRKGPFVSQEGIKSHLLKNIDNKKGKIKINLSLEQPLKITKEGELAVIRLKSPGTGDVRLTPVLVRAFDANMKKIEVECTETAMSFHVTE
jgi:type II secretory pathway component GspD/PulD (secretin)